MAVRFVVGGIGSGKTKFCMSEINKKLLGSKSELFFIVPEQAAVQAEKDFIQSSVRKGLLDVNVLSFKRLAFHILNELGGLGRKILEDQGKAMLIRKVLFELRDELSFYAKVADKPGFVDELSELVSELRKHSVDLALFENARESLRYSLNPGAQGLARKLCDLCLILQRYNHYLESNFISADEFLDVFAEKLEHSETLCNAELWIDGFFGYTLQELKVVEKLFGYCKTVTVTVCAFDIFKDEKEGIFSDVFRNYKCLLNICEKNNIQYEIIELNGSPDRKPDVGFLLDKAFGKTNGSFEGEIENIVVSSYGGPYDELKGLANTIHKLVGENAYRYRDIAVLMSSSELYASKLKARFKKHGIPVFMDEKGGIKSHQLAEFIRAAVDIVVYDRSYDTVFQFLKTGLCGISMKTVDKLENYVLEHGIKGYLWDKEWRFGSNIIDMAEGEEKGSFRLQLINNTRVYINERLKPLVSLGSKSKHSIRMISSVLYRLMLSCKVPEKLSYSATEFRRQGKNELALRQQQVWSKLVTLLDKFVELLGDELVDLSEYSKILGAGIESMKLGTAPATQDAVVVGDFSRSILPKIKVLFVVGLNDGVYPSVPEPKSLLSDLEKDMLNADFDIELQTSGIEKSYQDIFQFYVNLAKPREKIFISYALADSSGREYKPSILIEDLEEMFSGGLITKRDFGVDDICVKSEAFSLLAKNMEKAGSDELFSSLFSFFQKDSEYASKLEMLSQSQQAVGSEKLSRASIKQVFGDKLRTSVTKLEKYNKCPFSYFAQYVLNAGERKVSEMRSLDIGNYFHAILDTFTEKLIARNVDFTDSEALLELADTCIEERLMAFGSAERELFSSKQQSLYFKHRIKEFTKTSVSALLEHLSKGSFSPVFSELGFFDKPQDGKICFDAFEQKLSDGTSMIIEGRIDRIDLFEQNGEEFVKVMDYKSGEKSFDLVELYYGLSFQLTVYMHIFIKKYSEMKGRPDMVHPAAALYFLIKNPILKEDELKAGIQESMMNEFKMKGVVLQDEEIISKLDSALELGSSSIIPIYYTKPEKGSDKKKYHALFSNNVSESDFDAILDYSIDKALHSGEKIVSGDIAARPFKYKDKTGCEYCVYNAICRFDPLINNDGYMRLAGMNKQSVIGEINRKHAKE